MTTNADVLLQGFQLYDDEVHRVLAGRSHDGKLPLGFDLPFTERADVRLMASRLASLLLFQLCVRVSFPTSIFNAPHFRTTLIAKLLFHLTTHNLTTLEQIANLAPHMSRLATAICEAPDMLNQNTTIDHILRAHCRRAARKLRRINTLAGPKVHPRKSLWTGHDEFALEEITDPRHLLIDNAVLRHSIGRYYDTDAMAEVGITEDHPAACFFLESWRAIRKGHARIFTLTQRGIPRASLLYSTHEEIIAEVRSDLMPFTYDHELYWPLTAAMKHLGQTIEITNIDTQPWTNDTRNR